MQRYEEDSFPTVVLFFLAGFTLAVLCIGGYVITKWRDVVGIEISEEITAYAEWTREWWLIGASLSMIFLWVLHDRPRLVADPAGNVWVRNGGCGVVRFQWSDVVRWRVDVEQIESDEGMDVSRTIVVELAGDRVLRITDSHQAFVRAFQEHVPKQQIAEQVEA